jgi:integrase
VATGRAERDIAADLKGTLTSTNPGHHPAITTPKEAGELLRAIDGYTGSFVAQCGLRLAPLLFQRPGAMRQMEWSQIDFDTKEWRYFVTKAKTRKNPEGLDHIVPLSHQAVAILAELKPLTGSGRYVLPSERTPHGNRCMSENTLNAALKRIGYSSDKMVIHGFRAMARTIMDEVLGIRPDFIEHQLAHAVRDANGRAYNRTSFLADRHIMMQSWSDYLDILKNGAVVIPIHSTKVG